MSNHDWQNFFKPSDFPGIDNEFDELVSMYCADVANAILRAEIEKAPVVYGMENMVHGSSPRQSKIDTHSARLICIEKLKHDKSEEEG